MYERFTDRSRKVMQLAKQEAQRFRHEYIGTEHILLGLIAEGSGVAANVLKNLNVDSARVRREIEKIVQHGPPSDDIVMGRLPQTPRAKRVIDGAIEEARGLKHNYIGTEHLLLGLLREGEGVAALVLNHLGLSLEGTRAEVLNLLGATPPRVATKPHIVPTAEPGPAESEPTRPIGLTRNSAKQPTSFCGNSPNRRRNSSPRRPSNGRRCAASKSLPSNGSLPVTTGPAAIRKLMPSSD